MLAEYITVAYSKSLHSPANNKIIYCLIRSAASVIQEFNSILQPGIILSYDTLYVSLEKES